MAFYEDEQELWKCSKHPPKRRRSVVGVCPLCLRERLSMLCPDCAHARPCACTSSSASSSSSTSSSSSSFSRFFFADGRTTIGRVGNLIESEPAFRRSKSLAVPFFRSKSKRMESEGTTVSFWSSVLRLKKKSNSSSKKSEEEEEEEEEEKEEFDDMNMMRRSSSVSVGKVKGSGPKWYFPSPMKVLKQSRISKIVVNVNHQRSSSPLCRG